MKRLTLEHCLWSIAAAALVGTVAWPATLIFVPGISKDYEHWSNFSTALQALNVLYSLLGAAGLVITVVIALRQLKNQEAEIRDGQTDSAEQRHLLLQQMAASQKQAVRSQFFQMLSSWQEIARAVTGDFEQMSGRVDGRPALNEYGKRLREALSFVPPLPDESDAFRRKVIIDRWDHLLFRERTQLGHYFRLLYHIVRFVDRSPEITYDEKRDLIRILRAHISNAEFTLIFYNGLHPLGDRMYPLIEKYDLLHNMLPQDLSNPLDISLYPLTKKSWEDADRSRAQQHPRFDNA